MTIKQVKSLHNFIMIFQNHWSVYIVVYMLLVVSGQIYQVPLVHWFIWFGLGMLPLIFNKLKTTCKYKVMRYPVYAAVLFLVYMLKTPHMTYTFIYLLCVAYYCVNAEWYDWSKEDSSDYKPIPLVVVILMSLVVVFVFQWVRLYELQRTILYLLIWNVILYSVASYVNKYVKFLDVNRHSIGYMPIKSVLGSGILSMLGFSSILSVLLMIVAGIGTMGDVLQYIKGFIQKISRKIMEWLKEVLKKWLSGIDNTEVNIPEMQGTVSGMQAVGEDKWSVLDIVLAIIMGALALYAIYQILRFIFTYLSALLSYRGKGETTILKDEVQEKSDVVEKMPKRKRESLLEAITPAQRIRKRFRRKVLSEQKRIFDTDKRERMELYTARECADIMDTTEAAGIYEKARYSPFECTAEDVKKMKNACKSNGK